MPFQRVEISTERLLLRPWRMTDLDDASAYASDEEWARYLWNIPLPYTRQDAEAFVERVCQIDWTREADFAIEHGGRAIGGIRLYLTTPANDVAGLGYNVGRAYWNRGFVTEAVRAMLRYAFETSGLHEVVATADARNVAYIRVMEKVGMQQEALLREHRFYRGEHADEVHYGILASEWRSQRAT
jgi:RimJ/RimL family protein N-acetyltransferase